MLIHEGMHLDDLKTRMSSTEAVSDADAQRMRDMLVAEFDGNDTADIPEGRWHDMLARL